MMGKVLLMALTVWVIVVLIKRSLRGGAMRKGNAADDNASSAQQQAQNTTKNYVENHTENHTESMVQCVSCAVHLPRSEAFMVAGRFYCCQAHIQRQ